MKNNGNDEMFIKYWSEEQLITHRIFLKFVSKIIFHKSNNIEYLGTNEIKNLSNIYSLVKIFFYGWKLCYYAENY